MEREKKMIYTELCFKTKKGKEESLCEVSE